MKLIGLSLPYVVAATGLFATPSDEQAPRAKISSRLASEIRSSLPTYSPPPTDNPPETARSPADADVMVLPKVVVRENRRPKVNPDDLLTTKELDKKLAREFRNSLTGLDAVLNGFSIPLISPSMAVRGRAAYKARRLQDLNNFIDSASKADSKSSAEMKKAVTEMNKAEDWQNRVTGGR